MSGWQVVNGVGLVLVVAGLLGTILGVTKLARDLFPNWLHPVRRVWEWARVKLLRRTPRPQTIQGSGSVIVVTAGSGWFTATPPRPSDDAPLAEWIVFMDRMFSEHQRQIQSVRKDQAVVNNQFRSADRDEAAVRQEGDRQIANQTKAWLGGRNGDALAVTWWGLVVTLVGTVLQGLASIATG